MKKRRLFTDALYARVDSNHWPLVPETNALSGLSYGRVEKILTHTGGCLLKVSWDCAYFACAAGVGGSLIGASTCTFHSPFSFFHTVTPTPFSVNGFLVFGSVIVRLYGVSS